MAQQDPGTQQAHMSALQGNLIYVNMSSACACMCVSCCYLEVQALQEGTDVPCAGWRQRRAEIFPADKCIGHINMLIKLSKCKAMICLLAPPQRDFK